MKGGHRANTDFQEVVALRERGWEGLPPPPVLPTLTSGKTKPASTNQNDPAATPVVTSLGLPNRDLEPQILRPSPLESITAPEADTIHVSPITQSPSTSIASLSDFTFADTSDDESPTDPPIDPTIAGTSGDGLPLDPTTIAPHDTFYLEDGNVEVLCGNSLFRVHTSVLSFHSPALRRLFAQTSLAVAESPNGCPRILSSDTGADFVTLLKMIYLPGFVALPPCRWIVPLIICSSTDSLKGIQCRISPHSRPSSESRRSTRCPLSDLRYSTSSVMHTQRPLMGSLLPNRSERASSAGQLLTQMRSSISLPSRSSHSRYRWHTTWRPEGGWIR